MKALLALILTCVSLNLLAQEKTGVGVMLGNPTGLNAKRWLKDNRAVDVGIAWSIGTNSNFSLHSDYLLHNGGVLVFQEVYPLDLYYGVGGRMEFGHDIEVGVRVPVGLAHQIDEQSADIFAEVAPIVDFISKTGLELHLAIGARYYF